MTKKKALKEYTYIDIIHNGATLYGYTIEKLPQFFEITIKARKGAVTAITTKNFKVSEGISGVEVWQLR
jgi:hypothetical protein